MPEATISQVKTKPKKVKKGLLKRIYQYRMSYVLMAPFMIIFFLFIVWPVIFSFVLSFTSYNVLEAPKFVGLDNYVNLVLYDEVFGIAVRNTFVFAIITGPAGYILSLFFAWIINELPHAMRSIMTLIFYAPAISGTVYTIWLIIFNGDIYGYLNSFLIGMGFISTPIQWTTDTRYMMMVVIVVQLWLSLGTSFLTLRAGFNNVDKQYYEAAAIDGIRNRWQELWYITLPIMAPHLMLAAVLAITGAFGAEAVMTTMTGFPSTGYATHMVMHHLRDYGMLRFERGYACAIATLIFIVSVTVNQLVQRLLRKVGS